MDAASSSSRQGSGLFVFPPVRTVDEFARSVSVDSRTFTNETEEIKHLREVVRIQGEFIMSLKHQIRDFLGNA